MKAKDYYWEYKQKLFPTGINAAPVSIDDVQKSIEELRNKFMGEIAELKEVRRISRPDSANAILTEVNQKWNALCGIFERKHGVSPIKRDAIIDYWEKGGFL